MEKSEKQKIQWHPAFCSAVRLELVENKEDLDYRQEYNLNKKPLQIDLLVIRKSKDVLIDNEIGKLFKGHNIMEYKSPDDSMGIDIYFKSLAYACLYKADGKTENSILAEDVTISMVREGYPRELINYFKGKGYQVTKPYKGIYYVKKDGFFDTQIIVSGELEEDSHIWLKSLTNTLEEREAQKLILNLKRLTAKDEKELGESVLDVAVRANPNRFNLSSRKEEGYMTEYLREFFDDAINRLADEKAAKMADEMAAKMADEMAVKMADEMAAKMADEIAVKMADEMANKIVDERMADFTRAANEVTEKVTNEVTAKVTAKVTDEVTSRNLVSSVENLAENLKISIEKACSLLNFTLEQYKKAKETVK